MPRDMNAWTDALLAAPVKKALPVLSFPGAQLLGVSVARLINDAELQAEAMRLVAERCDTAAAASLMDLSLEAEAFGAPIKISDDEVPTVTAPVVRSADDARALRVPPRGAGRTGLYVEAVGPPPRRQAPRPGFAGVIGPFSLAGRLMDMTEIMIQCLEEPETVHCVLAKAADYLIDHVLAYRDAGADGFLMAEPAAGLLSPAINDEFSTPYVRRIIEATRTDAFVPVYHNCGNTVPLVDSILTNGARLLHFGNAVDMAAILEKMPADKIALGNIDPAGQFRNGTPESVREATTALLRRCAPGHPNFVVSSGCDIPPLAPWANIDAFFAAVRDYYAGR